MLGYIMAIIDDSKAHYLKNILWREVILTLSNDYEGGEVADLEFHKDVDPLPEEPRLSADEFYQEMAAFVDWCFTKNIDTTNLWRLSRYVWEFKHNVHDEDFEPWDLFGDCQLTMRQVAVVLNIDPPELELMPRKGRSKSQFEEMKIKEMEDAIAAQIQKDAAKDAQKDDKDKEELHIYRSTREWEKLLLYSYNVEASHTFIARNSKQYKQALAIRRGRKKSLPESEDA